MSDWLEPIKNQAGEIVGRYNTRTKAIIDSGKRGTLSHATANAGRKMSAKNPAERRTKQERKEAKKSSKRKSARRTRARSRS